MKNILLSFLASILAFACSSPKTHDYQGHWHSIENSQTGVYQTLDINDTASIIDYYTLTGVKFHPLPLKDGQNLVLPSNAPYYSKDINFHGDTLVIEKEFQYIKLEGCTFEEDLFSNLFIDIKLPRSAGELPLDLLDENIHHTFISVGKLKDGIVYKNAEGELINSDEYFIQVNDVLPGMEYITVYLQSEKYTLQEGEQLMICLNLDRDVPETLIKELFSTINSANVSKNVYRIVWDELSKQPSVVKLNLQES